MVSLQWKTRKKEKPRCIIGSTSCLYFCYTNMVCDAESVLATVRLWTSVSCLTWHIFSHIAMQTSLQNCVSTSTSHPNVTTVFRFCRAQSLQFCPWLLSITKQITTLVPHSSNPWLLPPQRGRTRRKALSSTDKRPIHSLWVFAYVQDAEV